MWIKPLILPINMREARYVQAQPWQASSQGHRTGDAPLETRLQEKAGGTVVDFLPIYEGLMDRISASHVDNILSVLDKTRAEHGDKAFSAKD